MPTSIGELIQLLNTDTLHSKRALASLTTPTIFLVNVGTLTSVPTISTSEQTVSVPGLNVGDAVTVNKPTHQTGLGIVGARVSAKDTLAITFMNPTVAGIVPTASEIYKVVRFQVNQV